VKEKHRAAFEAAALALSNTANPSKSNKAG
jgi:hypothetical protein